MIAKNREKILTATALALVAVVVLYYAFFAFRGTRGALAAKRSSVETEVERKENRLRIASRAAAKLKTRREQSLPADPAAAQSLYQTWLREAATDAGFSETAISAVGNVPTGDVYRALRFKLVAKANLDQLTEFLHRFYRSGYLHQIPSMSVTPDDRGKSLDLQMTIDALSVVGATQKGLTKVDSDRTLAALDVYRKKIGGRNVFAIYEPAPPSAAPPRTEGVDALKFAELNAVTSGIDGRPRAWINAKMTGKHYELFEGDEVEIGETKCKMIRIGEREAEIEREGKRYLVPLGGNLLDAKLLPDKAAEAKSK